MKILAKAAFGALILTGAVAASVAPANAHVSIGIGVPGPYGSPFYGPPCAYQGYSPYCDYGYYDGPVFIDGIWLPRGHYSHRFWGGHHQFLYNGSWQNGAWGRSGHWGGHGGWGHHR